MSSKPKSMARGFTIVELILVIVVIAILALITIVTYSNVQSNSHSAVAKADLAQAYNQLALYQVDNSAFPATLIQAGIKLNASTSFYYILNSDSSGYCLAASNGGNQFYLTNSNNTPRSGSCPLIVSTLAGSTSGSADGQGTAAQFYEPTSIVMSPDGNLYVADYSNNEIRKVTQAGYVTTFAGATTAGAVDGTGTSARFNHPGGLAVDSVGNLYVADQFNSLIRKITPSGVVSTIAGSSYGFADGTGTSAQFAEPWGVAVDGAGNVYVADTYNSRIRKITPSGVVTTIAGSSQGYADGPGSSALFNYPAGVAVASDGSLYIADQDNNRIRKISTSGIVSTFVGSGNKSSNDGSGTTASFASPHSVSFDAAGNLYVGDEYSHKVRKITPDGIVATLAGTVQGYLDGNSSVAEFSHPLGIVAAPSGIVYVVERGNNTVRVIQYQ